MGIWALELHRPVTHSESVVWLLVKVLRMVLNCLPQGMPDFLFMHSKEQWYYLFPENKTMTEMYLWACFNSSFCLQLFSFELLDLSDKWVAQIKTNSWHLSSWDEKASPLHMSSRVWKRKGDLIPLCNDTFHFQSSIPQVSSNHFTSFNKGTLLKRFHLL